MCSFLLYHKVNQLYIYIYPHIPSLLLKNWIFIKFIVASYSSQGSPRKGQQSGKMKSFEDSKQWLLTLVMPSFVTAPFTPSHIFLSSFPTAFPHSLSWEKPATLADTLYSCCHLVQFSFAGSQVMDPSLHPIPNLPPPHSPPHLRHIIKCTCTWPRPICYGILKVKFVRKCRAS